jgi:hypothetical protein
MSSLNRKEFLKQFGLVGVSAIGASTLLAACGGGGDSATQEQSAASSVPADPCKDTSSLTQADKDLRTNLGYLEETEIADQRCENCQLYKQPENGGCGGCLLFNGPVTTNGWCKSWVTNQG